MSLLLLGNECKKFDAVDDAVVIPIVAIDVVVPIVAVDVVVPIVAVDVDIVCDNNGGIDDKVVVVVGSCRS